MTRLPGDAARAPGDADLIEPIVEQLPARLAPGPARSRSVSARSLCEVDAGGGELERMADQPALDPLGVLLDMELQRQHLAVVGAKAWFGVIAVSASQVAPRGRSNVSPCQCSTLTLVLSERGERRFAPVGRQADQAPADLLLAAG